MKGWQHEKSLSALFAQRIARKSKTALLPAASDKGTLYAAIGGVILAGSKEYNGERSVILCRW
jgi:hypothetical protein